MIKTADVLENYYNAGKQIRIIFRFRQHVPREMEIKYAGNYIDKKKMPGESAHRA